MAIDRPVLLDLPAAIETPSLRLRPPQAGDGRALYEAISESLASLRQFLASLPWVAGEQSIENSEAWARQSAANFLARKDMPFLIFEKRTQVLLGATGLHRMEWSVPKAEIGYWCRTSRSGQGVVTEAVQAVCAYAYEHMRVERLEIVTDEANAASRRVAERCGFKLEALLQRERRAPDGSLRNTCIYARLR